MQSIRIGLLALSIAAIGLGAAGCQPKQKATVDTGTAKATVTTTANTTEVTPSQLETAAAVAATAASKPVDGSGPVNSLTPSK